MLAEGCADFVGNDIANGFHVFEGEGQRYTKVKGGREYCECARQRLLFLDVLPAVVAAGEALRFGPAEPLQFNPAPGAGGDKVGYLRLARRLDAKLQRTADLSLGFGSP